MKKILFLPALLLLCGILPARGNTPVTDSAAVRLARQLAYFPHEKIHVQTDKPHYLSGERMWLRAHLVDALNHRPMFMSRYVYVELFNPFGELVRRAQIRPDSTGAYAGYIDLDQGLPEGGWLVPGQVCRVGFKAVNPSGTGEEISGTVYNSREEEVTRFSSLKLGMGFFVFIPAEGERYHAVCATGRA